MSVWPDPKPVRRHVAKQDEYTQIRQAKKGPCRACERNDTWYSAGNMDMHHLVQRSQGGDDVPDNMVPLCRRCHSMFEDRAPGWHVVGQHMFESLTFPELVYVLRAKPVGWIPARFGLGL